ncbi:hypothetical protein [Ohtaekwangia koreensis]|uniref:Uncharacterized protein n=1 Tax=Ohtaekwangia koreensis TaxID=688867 RepID=A0A1T5M822_9BACT|nr:hypothetical protein [Ohtaekwangia koreensis]SKC84391.1 hypothetical protein SAMN05660236_4768 [Ohtaekwangia koreensis]
MNEGEIVTVDKLKKEWDNVLSLYDLFINGGHNLRPIRFIIRHIIERGYNMIMFPGTSMYTLLISLPEDNKVNYNKTLRIEFDQRTENLKFRFSDWTGIDRQNADLKKQIKWEETCQATEGSSLLESFLADNMDFRRAIKNETRAE